MPILPSLSFHIHHRISYRRLAMPGLRRPLPQRRRLLVIARYPHTAIVQRRQRVQRIGVVLCGGSCEECECAGEVAWCAVAEQVEEAEARLGGRVVQGGGGGEVEEGELVVAGEAVFAFVVGTAQSVGVFHVGGCSVTITVCVFVGVGRYTDSRKRAAGVELVA